MFRINPIGVERTMRPTGIEIKSGRFLGDDESRRRASVLIIGEDIQQSWFPRGYALGKWIEVNGSKSVPGQDDLRVLLPYWTLRKFFPKFLGGGLSSTRPIRSGCPHRSK
jgi:hypothetical protein